ncbi:MAG: ESPR-type extended signal peptide-containing protein, partial [Succiniclasticum sp.]|nr:ESPR-type extended signal peptide-containing protein [Succiniclasticum sp.]
MNKAYKVIWSKVKGCYVVVSELAKERGKNNSRGKHALLAGIVMATLLGGAFLPAGTVFAANDIHYVAVGVNTSKAIEARKYPGETIEESAVDPNANKYFPLSPTFNFISIGAEASAGANGAVAMGFKTTAKGEYSTALGTGSGAYSKGDLALGWKAYTGWNEPNKIAIGTESTALKENGISIGKKSKTWDKNAIAIGNEAETGNEGDQTSNDSIAIGNKAKIQGQHNVAIGSGVTIGTGAKNDGSSYVVAIGSDSHAYDTDSIVIGGNSEVRENATVIGNRTKAGMESVALGSEIKAGEWSIAIGLKSKAKNHAIAMGMDSDVSGENSIGIGRKASASLEEAVSIGYDAHAEAKESLAVGNRAVVSVDNTTDSAKSTAVGPQAKAYGTNATALGSAQVGYSYAKVNGGTAVGSGAGAFYTNATALGYKSIAYGKDAVTLGANTRVNIDGGAVALGSDSQATVKAGVYGYDPYEEGRKQESPTWKSTKAAVSVGKDVYDYNLKKQVTETRQITNVAAGAKDTDAVNVAQLKALNQKVDEGAVHYFSVAADDSAKPENTNWNNDGATGAKAIAIGRGAKAHGEHSIALGSDGAEFSAPKTTGAAAIAIGSGAEAGVQDISIGLGAKATGGFGVAIGRQSEAKASTAVAMAYGAKAEGANSLAIGILSDAKTNDSAAYGREAKALGDVSLAVGAQSKAGADHAAVFGAEATTDATAWNGTAIGRSAYIGKQAPDGTTPNIGVSNNYFTPVDDDTVVAPGKETMNSTAVGFGAKAFG